MHKKQQNRPVYPFYGIFLPYSVYLSLYYQLFVNCPCVFLLFPVNGYGTDFDSHTPFRR